MLVCLAAGLGLLGVAEVRRSYVDWFCVEGASMQPTLRSGDCVVVRKGRFTPAWEASGGGAVVVLRLETGGYAVKRLIAGPGDTVEVQGGQLLINGAALHEPYLAPESAEGVEPPGDWHYSFLLPDRRTAAYKPTARAWGPLVVPEGEFFVLGDNRRHSGDSRYFGFVNAEEMVGVPRVIWAWRRP